MNGSQNTAKDLVQAVMFATEHHSGQVRKGTNQAYIIHPLETMMILSHLEADINLQIAGLFHDLLEDTDTTMEEITMSYGEDVATLVKQHSEDKSKSWLERKTATIATLQQADKRSKMLALADKLSNLRSIVKDYATLGDAIWERFNAPKEKQAWYYAGILNALSDLQQYTPETAEAYKELVDCYKDVFVIYKVNTDYTKLYQANAFGEAYCLSKDNPQWIPVNYRFRQNDITLTRQDAELLEEKWRLE